jgi:hypothetical protein
MTASPTTHASANGLLALTARGQDGGWSRDGADQLSVLVLFVVTFAVVLTFRDFGLGWDDFTQAQYGELLLHFYGSGFTDRRALDFVNLHYYGGGFDMAAALLAKILPIDLFELRRLLGGLVGIAGIGFAWRTARHVAGPVAGLVTVLLLATCPLFIGHMIINSKDGPFAVAMALLLLGLVRAFKSYPTPGKATVILVGLGLGLSIGSRILGFLSGPTGVAALAVMIGVEARSLGARAALRRAGQFVVYLLPALVVGYLVMIAVWPWAALSPLNPIVALEYFSHFFEAPWHEMFAGQLLLVPDMPRRYVPTLFSLQMPLVFLLLMLAGTLIAIIAPFQRGEDTRMRALLVLLATAAFFPIVITVVERPAMYNGIRHFMFTVPPMAGLGGAAGALLWQRLAVRKTIAAAAVVVFALALLPPVITMARLHPYEYTYFNVLEGGVRGARGQYAIDYWGLSFKQAGTALRKMLTAKGEHPPAGRKWLIAVRGPQPSAEAALGPDFDTTWDTKGADFVLKLDEFYCAAMPGTPLLTITRAGVPFAQAYDIRLKTAPPLLTQPPP